MLDPKVGSVANGMGDISKSVYVCSYARAKLEGKSTVKRRDTRMSGQEAQWID